jgi:energy-coupling factor transporter transmembrane protein EcfT
MALKERTALTADRLGKGIWFLCLGFGTILLVAGKQLWVPGIGLALTATAFFWRLSDPKRIRSLVKWMIPVLVFLCAYGLLLHLTSPAQPSAPFSAHPLTRVAHLFLRSMGMIFAMFALEEALRPVALRARAGGFKGGRMALMLGLSYQLIPVFLQSLEGVALAQRADAGLWWLRPSSLMRAASSVFLLSHRLSEELALALSLRLRHAGRASEKNWLHDLSGDPRPARSPTEEDRQASVPAQ